MAMSALAQTLVVGTGPRLALHRDASPVVERQRKLGVTGPTHLHRRSTLFAGAFGYWSRPCQPPKSVVISATQWFPSLCHHLGADDRPDSYKR